MRRDGSARLLQPDTAKPSSALRASDSSASGGFSLPPPPTDLAEAAAAGGGGGGRLRLGACDECPLSVVPVVGGRDSGVIGRETFSPPVKTGGGGGRRRLGAVKEADPPPVEVGEVGSSESVDPARDAVERAGEAGTGKGGVGGAEEEEW